MAGPAVIYGLTCPDTGSIRYIGKANNPEKRFASHLRDARTRTTPVYGWITKLVNDGKRPGLVVLEDAQDWVEAERRWIAVSRARGDQLLNVADGGDQPGCRPEVLSANGARTAQKRKDCPMFYTKHALLRGIGCVVRNMEERGNLDVASRLRSGQAKIQRMDEETLFWRVFKRKNLAWCLPDHIRADAELYRGLV